MEHDIIICALVFFGIVYITLIFLSIRERSIKLRKLERELSKDSHAYPKVTGEPIWFGIIPHVDDYTEPRYVYENLEESVDYLPINGRIIGYRVSPDLVIHSTIVEQISSSVLASYIERLGGKLLDEEEMKIFVANWDKISVLREKIGLKLLDDMPFWFSQFGVPYAGYKDGTHRDFIGSPMVGCMLILKR